VRDAERQKMSKTKGNVIDPLVVTEKYGTDAVRMALLQGAAPGTDIVLTEERMESSRAFANKIWNAARFLFMNVDRAQEAGVWSLGEFERSASDLGSVGVPGFNVETLEDRWILSRFNRVAREIHEALEAYRFHEAAHVVYHFFWGEFCDWYIELMKPRLSAGDRDQTRTAFSNVVSIFEGALRLLSPFMPFITEELWHAVYDGSPPLRSIALAAYPRPDSAQVDTAAETEMAIVQDLIAAVRNIRTELKVDRKQKLPIEVFADAEVIALIERDRAAIDLLADVGGITFVKSSLAKAAGARSTARFDVSVVYERKIDVASERDRLNKELAKLSGELSRATAQLSNDGFLAKAPPQVVDGLKRRKGEVEVLVEKAKAALEELDTVNR